MTKLEQAVTRFQRADAEMKAAAGEVRRIISEARNAARSLHADKRRPISSEDADKISVISRTVADFHELAEDDLIGIRRLECHVTARYQAMVIAADLLRIPDMYVAAAFNRGHTMMIHARRGVGSRAGTEPHYKAKYELLIGLCRAALEKKAA